VKPAASALPPKPTVAGPAQTAPPPSPSLAAGYYINVGLFAEETNAKNAHTKLLDAGLTAFVQEIKTPKGKRIRVRAGPFDSEAQADAAATRIRGLQLEAVVFQQ
jgi:cell division septation protein DedD